MSIVLLGTSHGDPLGKERLDRSLAIVSPKVITVEASQDLIELRRGDQELFDELVTALKRKKINQDFINYFISTLPTQGPFELHSAHEYATRHRIPLRYIDDPSLESAAREEGIRYYRELIDGIPHGAVLKVPAKGKLKAMEEGNYIFADAAMTQPEAPQVLAFLDTTRGPRLGQKDRYMEGGIRKLQTEDPELILAHIGGFVHMFDDPRGETLYSRIKDLNPQRRLIYNPDKVF